MYNSAHSANILSDIPRIRTRGLSPRVSLSGGMESRFSANIAGNFRAEARLQPRSQDLEGDLSLGKLGFRCNKTRASRRRALSSSSPVLQHIIIKRVTSDTESIDKLR